MLNRDDFHIQHIRQLTPEKEIFSLEYGGDQLPFPMYCMAMAVMIVIMSTCQHRNFNRLSSYPLE